VTGLIHINSAIWKIGGLLFYFGRFNFEACDVCKVLMRGSYNLSLDVKVTKNVGRPSCQIITNKFFS
jgi:hypothetical protein